MNRMFVEAYFLILDHGKGGLTFWLKAFLLKRRRGEINLDMCEMF